MPSPLDRAAAALLPTAGLAALAGLRCRDDVRIVVHGERAWATWPPGETSVWRALLAAPGIQFFERRGDQWHELGYHLPRFDVPFPGEPRRLDALIFPAPIEPVPPRLVMITPVQLGIVPGESPRPTTALRAKFVDLMPWIDAAPSAELQACRGATCGDQVLLRGPRLPTLPRAERFWGQRVLAPVGMRPDPDLPEAALREAADVALDELLILTQRGAEAIAESLLQPLTRAALRIASLRDNG